VGAVPLGFDLSYDECLAYQGTNPRPEDLDAFWDAGLAELAAIDPQVEITPADFAVPFARCEHLYFTGTGGARVHAKLVRPAESNGSAVLFFHGYSGMSQDWTTLLPFAARGQTVAALDVRGQAGLSEDTSRVTGWTLRSHLVRGLDDGPEQLFFRQVFLDTRRLADLVAGLDGIDPDRIATTGGSQGGALSLVCAALQPRITLVASIFPFLTDYQRAWELALEEAPYDEITEWFRRRDPQHKREKEVFTRLGYIDVQHLAPRITAKVDLTVSLEDKVCPPSTQFAAYNKLTCEKSLRVYPDHGHDTLPGLDDELYQLLGTI
jgi:cephalosporin-C deacetylase